MSGYLTGLGQTVVVPPTVQPGYQKALQALNKYPKARAFVQTNYPTLAAWLSAEAVKMSSDTYVIDGMQNAYTYWLPTLRKHGETYRKEIRWMEAALTGAAFNATQMADLIVRLRSSQSATYLDDKWGAKTTEFWRGYLINVKITSDRVRTMLDTFTEEAWPRAVIWEKDSSGAPNPSANLTHQQYTKYRMMLWWDGIRLAVGRMAQAWEDYEWAQKGKPARPTPPDNPEGKGVGATPQNPEGGAPPTLPPALLGVSLLAVIAWWLMKPRRVESL